MVIPPRAPAVCAGVLAAAMCLTPRLAATQASNWDRIARAIVGRVAPDKGERVLLVGVPGMADSLVPYLRAALRDAGAQDLGALAASGTAPKSWDTQFTAGWASATGPDAYIANVDVGVMLPGATVTHPIYTAFQRLIATRGEHRRTIHFHWSGAYALNGAIVEVTPERSTLYQRALIETNYSGLGVIQREFEKAMRTGGVRVTTPGGTDLRFTIGDRPVTRQDGDAEGVRARQARNLIDREFELPAGAIRVAPIEESVSGTVAFPPSDWGGERVEGLVMRFEKGRVVSYDARTGKAAVDRELQRAGDGGRAFREFALGFNPLLAIPATGERWIPYYGYGAGVVRLSLGDNSELGGKVTGGYVRWNFFTDATVTVGNDVWVRGGELQRQLPTP